jgi:hypothetical protein
MNIEIKTQRKILESYMRDIQPNRDHEQDIQWMRNNEIKKTRINTKNSREETRQINH